MEPRRMSVLIGWGFFFSLLCYGTFLASVIMAAIFMMVDRDRALVGVTGIDPHGLKELLFGLQVTSMVGLGLALLPLALSIGGSAVVLANRLKRKGLSLAAVALALTSGSVAGEGFLLFHNPSTRIGQQGAPFEVGLVVTKGTQGEDVVVRLHATRGNLDAAKEYTFTVMARHVYGWEPPQAFDVTSAVRGTVVPGKDSAEAHVPDVQVKSGYDWEFYVIAQPSGRTPACAEEAVSEEVRPGSSW